MNWKEKIKQKLKIKSNYTNINITFDEKTGNIDVVMNPKWDTTLLCDILSLSYCEISKMDTSNDNCNVEYNVKSNKISQDYVT